ncbi:uncharacterized protein LOC119954411 [Scyliorhinus canicula]|uniref:uncharacterized protein LOC119954411 n=1 Tax=Scyliorhinus canicula TaxID=7830 RepID=UPI0018F559C2|nr:uncharacterized protein LOC119954411 [Scyliorhinus canicula]
MKIFAVALLLLIVKGNHGGVIPKGESKSSRFTHRQISYRMFYEALGTLAGGAFQVVAESEIGRLAESRLAKVERHFHTLFRHSMEPLVSLMKDIGWRGENIGLHILKRQSRVSRMLASAVGNLFKAIGNETTTPVYEKLVLIVENLRHNSQNLTNSLDQVYLGTIHQLKQSRNITAPYTANMIREVRNGLTDVVHGLKEGLKELVKLSATPATAAEKDTSVGSDTY